MTIATQSRPQPAEPVDPPEESPVRSRLRRVTGVTLTVLAAALVFFALLAPNMPALFTARAFLRLPVEAIVLVAVFLVVPARWRSGGRGCRSARCWAC